MPTPDATTQKTADERAATGSHVGYCPTCGHMIAAYVDDASTQEERDEHAQFVADLVRRGFRPGYTTCAAVRAATWCVCKRKVAK